MNEWQYAYDRILIFGMPGSPIFEIGDRLAGFREYEFYTIQRLDTNNKDPYFIDTLPQEDIDVGDFISGSQSQHMDRIPSSRMYEKFLELPVVPDANSGLTQRELLEIFSITKGILSTEIPDPRLIQWAEKVVCLESDVNKAQAWFGARRKCFTCGSVFHLQDRPPIIPGICDRCGTDLHRKKEDHPNLVRNQFKQWRHLFWKIKNLSIKENKFFSINIDQCRTLEHVAKEIDKHLRLKKRTYDWSYAKR